MHFQELLHARVFPLLLLPLLLLSPLPGQAGTYSEKKNLHDTLLASSNYNPEQRPVLDQADTLVVQVMFALVSIVEINDVVQSFRCNGFLGLFWTDEILKWNSSDYGGETVMAPKITSVFRPRLIMLNTMGDRDLFQDDYAPLSVYSNGLVNWAPGSIFPAACRLDLTKYPFDSQHCEIEMIIMNFDANEVRLEAVDSTVGLGFFTENGQWGITDISVTTPIQDIGNENKSLVVISFDVKRKPTFLVISMLLPIVFLSLLNLLVFVIPVDSGEKISYGITVLLALSVFMSIISSLLPSSSESMPLMISYIFILMIISVLTVVDAIIIVGLHHMEEKEEKSQKAKANFRSTLPKLSLLKKAVAPFQTPPVGKDGQASPEKPGLDDVNSENGETPRKSKSSPPTLHTALPQIAEPPAVNKYKMIGRHIDTVSLMIFSVIWISVTLGFMLAISV